MEHRYTDRKRMVLDVVVVCPCLGLVRGQSVNLGNGGMFVQTGCITLPVNAPVKIHFHSPGPAAVENAEITGMVVHQKDEGFGMMFDELDGEHRHLLDQLLGNGEGGREAATPASQGLPITA